MDKIWYRNPSKSGSLAIVAGMKKRMTTQNRQKSNAKKKQNKKAQVHLGDPEFVYPCDAKTEN